MYVFACEKGRNAKCVLNDFRFRHIGQIFGIIQQYYIGQYCRIWPNMAPIFGTVTPFPSRGIPQPGLSAARRVGRPARASEKSADCATWWSWSPRPDELTVGTAAVPRVVERVAGSCQPIHVIRRQSWITVHLSITASPARAPLVARVAKGIVD